MERDPLWWLNLFACVKVFICAVMKSEVISGDADDSSRLQTQGLLIGRNFKRTWEIQMESDLPEATESHRDISEAFSPFRGMKVNESLKMSSMSRCPIITALKHAVGCLYLWKYSNSRQNVFMYHQKEKSKLFRVSLYAFVPKAAWCVCYLWNLLGLR